MYDFARRIRQLLEPERQGDPPGPNHDGIGNQERLRRLREMLPAAHVELPDIDADVSLERGVHLDGNLGAVQFGDTRIQGPSGAAHLGLWEDEYGLQQGLSVGGTVLTAENSSGQAEMGTSRVRFGAMNDEDGLLLGGGGSYGLARVRSEDGVAFDVASGDVEAGIRDGEDGMSVGAESDHRLVGFEAPGYGVHGVHASTTARVGENGAELSVAGNLLDGSNDMGSVERSADRIEHRVEGGLSAGEGVGVRARWGGDADGDGHETVGGGFDFGPLTGDLYTEDFDSIGPDVRAGRMGHRTAD